MRPIKFRGEMYGGNEKVYGDLVHENGHTYIINVAREHHRVYENTVAQLVGYDANGKEVYEGDTVVGVADEWVAVLKSDILDSKECVREAPLKYLTLKEINQ